MYKIRVAGFELVSVPLGSTRSVPSLSNAAQPITLHTIVHMSLAMCAHESECRASIAISGSDRITEVHFHTNFFFVMLFQHPVFFKTAAVYVCLQVEFGRSLVSDVWANLLVSTLVTAGVCEQT